MNTKTNWQKALFTGLVLWSFMLNSVPLRAQTGDIVGSDDISGGSSVFVFRQSRKAPQTKFAARAKTSVKRSTSQKATSRKSVSDQVAKATPKRENPTKVVIPPKTPTNVASKMQTSNLFAITAEDYLAKGQIDDSITWFRKSVDLNKDNKNAQMGLSEALTRKGDQILADNKPEYAQPLYNEALKLNPKNSGAYAGLGGVFEDMNDPDQSFTNYDTALKLNPDLTELYAPIGATYYAKGDLVKADELLTKAVARNAEDDQTQLLIGVIRYKQNQNQPAIDALKKSLAIKETAEAHYYLGEIYDRIDRDKDAFNEYNRAVAMNPKFTEAWFDLGAANYNRGQYDAAINAYSQAEKLKNDDPEIHENLADVYRQTKQYDKAAGEYHLATVFVERKPKADQDPRAVADLYSKWGFVLGRTEKWTDSIAALNKAVALTPDNVDYTNLGWALYNSAQIDIKANDQTSADVKLKQGRDALTKATATNTQDPAAFMNLGLTNTDLKDYQAATDAFKKCIALKDKWVPAYNELGYALRMMNDYEGAIKNFKRASDLDGNYYPALYNWAESEYRRGNMKEARRIQDKLKKVNPLAAGQLEGVLQGIPLTTDPKKAVENKINEKNPLKKIPKLPPY